MDKALSYLTSLFIPSKLALIEKVLSSSPDYIAVVIGDIHQRHNISAVIRTYDCFAVFFGNEKEGLSDYVFESADDYLYVSKYDFIESLNISSASAAMVMTLYERIVALSKN